MDTFRREQALRRISDIIEDAVERANVRKAEQQASRNTIERLVRRHNNTRRQLLNTPCSKKINRYQKCLITVL